MAAKKQTAGRVVLRRTLLDHVQSEKRFIGAGNQRQRLSFSEIENAYQHDALVYRGINKKSRDIVKKWHGFAPADLTLAAADPAVVQQLVAWSRKVNLPVVLRKAVSDVLLYGDAYIEKVYAGDTALTDAPTNVKGAPEKLVVVNPTTLRPVRDTDPNSATLGDVLYFEQVVAGADVKSQTKDTEAAPNGVRFHPSRIEHLQYYDVGDDARGVGAVEAAYINVLSKIKADVSLGDLVHWYAKGFFTLNIEEASDEDIDEGYKMLADAREKGINYFAGSEMHKFDIKVPGQIDPTGILTSFYTNLSAALDMPKDMLIGASAGAVSGSQTNLRDYYEDTQAMVEEMSPVVENLYAAALGTTREALPIIVKWNRLYVDEKTEADTLFQNAQAASVAWRDGVMTVNEYRSRLSLPPIPDGDRYFEPAPPMDMPPPEGADAPPEKLGWRSYFTRR